MGGLFLLLVSLGLAFIISLPCSILAIVFGVQGTRRVDRGETDRNRGVAQAGVITGVVGVVLAIAAVVVWAILIVAAIQDPTAPWNPEP